MSKIAVLFPGQGAQSVGMGAALCDRHPRARETFDAASEALGFDVAKLCFEGDLKTLTRTSYAQPLILTASVAAYEVFSEELELQPSFMAGHSLGEYTALTCAKALSFSDAVRIVRRRGELMEQADPTLKGTMAAVKDCPERVIAALCEELSSSGAVLVAANFNSPSQTVISGDRSAVEKAAKALEGHGAKVVFLNVSAAFHSPHMAAASDLLREALADVRISTPSVPVIGNVDAHPHGSPEEIRARLVTQLTAPVRWVDTMAWLEREEVDFVIDSGPKAILRDLSKACSKSMAPFALDAEEDRARLAQKLFSPNLLFLGRALGIAAATRNRNESDAEHQSMVVAPYRKAHALYKAAVEEGRLVKRDDVRAALSMVLGVLRTKNVPESEARERVEGLFAETGISRELLNEVAS